MQKEFLLDRIAVNPDVMAGKPVIKGTRIPVQLVIQMLADGLSKEEILSEYPRLQTTDITACLIFAAETLNQTSFGSLDNIARS